MSSWINIQNVEKKIDRFQLGPINLNIYPGTITALVGNNGSGKSTLFKMMMDLVNFDKGSIEIFNKNVNSHDESWKKDIAYQPQTQIGFDAFTGNQLRDLISEWYPNWDEQLFIKIVNLLDISLTNRFSKLSQGNQQKLVLALTIARNTKILLLDEPTSFLDIPSKKALIDLLIDWMEQDERSIIFASHQADDIQKIADYITVLKHGRLIGHYEKEQLVQSYKRIWIEQPLNDNHIPGEIVREEHSIISNNLEQTEQYLIENEINILKVTAIDLEESISLLLERG